MFLNDDFLLTTDVAKKLFHEHAEKMPIIDYHCHLNPKEIYEDKPFDNITQAWLYGDHYKWRLMRANGVDENLITGNASDYERFLAWAKTVPTLVGNPLYAWTHLELKRFFGIDKMLNEESAKEIYNEVNAKLAQSNYTRRAIIRNANVKLVVTTDDPIDNLEYHELLAKEDMGFKVLPAFRPDACFNIDFPRFTIWFKQLEEVAETKITSLAQYKEVLTSRIQYFADHGCVLSDHGLDDFTYTEADPATLEDIFSRAIAGKITNPSDVNVFKTHLLNFLIETYHQFGWTTQLHLKALRNANRKMFEKLGPDTGYDATNDQAILPSIQKLLDHATYQEACPKVILYSLNQADFIPLITLMQCFQEGKIKQKFQLGSAWWFNDTRQGMRYQLQTLADNSILSNFVGMLTDSRSFLSYTRHEYFRRVLCELMGEWVSRGEVPEDYILLGKIVEDISFNNVNTYFNFNV